MISRPWWLRRPAAAEVRVWKAAGACPRCGSMKHLPIYYGLMHTQSGPVVERPFVERHRAPDGPKPDRHCSNCGIDFHAADQDTGRTE